MLTQNLDYSKFYADFESIGLLVDDIDTSGSLVRCPTISKPYKKNGAYIFFSDSQICWSMNWESGEERKTIKDMDSSFSNKELERIRVAKQKNQADRIKLQEEVSEKATKLWNEALQVYTTTYTKSKGVKCYTVRRKNDSLVIPLRDKQGKIWSLQYINPDGSKKFLKGGRKKGCYFEIKGNETIVLCEGYATGASIHEATGYTVIVCFDGNNMVEVAKIFPECIIGADNDVNDTGKNFAERTAKQYYLPPLLNGQSTDFNDLHQAKGLDTVKAIFQGKSNSASRSFQKGNNVITNKNMEEYPSFIEVTINKNGITKRVIRPLLAQYIRENENFLFVQDGAGAVIVYWYVQGVYVRIGQDDFKSRIKKHITDYDINLLKMADIEEVYKDLMTDGSYHKDSELNADRNIINFQNGILNLNTKQLEPHSAQILSTIQVPCNYEPKRKETPNFDAFIKFFTNNDEEKTKFYLQWIGVIVSNIPVHIFKKALLIIGKPHSGKSVFLDFLKDCLGNENYASIDLGYLEKNNFALSTLHNKRLAFCGDMSFIKIDELKNFKNITGGDAIKIEYKGQKAFSTTYKGALMFNANAYPRFGGDTGKAVFDRFIALSADCVMPEEQQDNLLREKLVCERDSIISRAIDELYNVINNGYKFDIPQESKKMIDSYKSENSHAIEFYKEYCINRSKDKYKNLTPIHDLITQKVVYAVFKEWSIQTHGTSYVTSKANFEKEICSYLEVDKVSKKTNGGKQYYSFIVNSIACQEFNVECVTKCILEEIKNFETMLDDTSKNIKYTYDDPYGDYDLS